MLVTPSEKQKKKKNRFSSVVQEQLKNIFSVFIQQNKFQDIIPQEELLRNFFSPTGFSLFHISLIVISEQNRTKPV